MDKKFKYILYSFLAFFFLILAVFCIPKIFSADSRSTAQELSEWFYYDEANERVDFSLPEKLYKNENGYTEIHTILPEIFCEPQVICFWTFYQSVTVYIDGDPIYHFDNSGTDSFGGASTSQWNLVEVFSEDADGKLLTLKFYTPYKDVNLRLTEVMYGKTKPLYQWLNGTYSIYRLLDILFIVVGFFMLLFAVTIVTDDRHRRAQLYAGIVFIQFGIYLMTGTKALPIYNFNNYTREVLYFCCLLMLGVPFNLYIRARIADKNHLLSRWCGLLSCIETISACVMLLLHIFKFAELHYTISFTYILLSISAITAVITSVYFLAKEKNKMAILSLVSSLFIFVVMLAEYLQFYSPFYLPFDTGFLSRIGALIVVILEVCVQSHWHIRERAERKQHQADKKNLELQLLTSQIKPHFMLNTVGAIRTLIHEDPDRASDLLYEFSKYVRKNLEQKDYSKPIPFLEELDYIRTYLTLECARFGSRLNVEYDIETTEFWVLPLTIQPFVENAVKHGLFPVDRVGTLRISTRADEKGNTVVLIEDDGVGCDVEQLEKILQTKKTVGMRSAMMRLREELGGEVTFKSNTHPDTSGFTVKITLSRKEAYKNENHYSR